MMISNHLLKQSDTSFNEYYFAQFDMVEENNLINKKSQKRDFLDLNRLAADLSDFCMKEGLIYWLIYKHAAILEKNFKNPDDHLIRYKSHLWLWDLNEMLKKNLSQLSGDRSDFKQTISADIDTKKLDLEVFLDNFEEERTKMLKNIPKALENLDQISKQLKIPLLGKNDFNRSYTKHASQIVDCILSIEIDEH